MRKLKLEDYIHLLDRMLEREGFADDERDEIFNYSNNIDLISAYFDHKKHPSLLIKKLDRSPVQAMYASSIDEAKRKPSTKKGKEKKFKRVMGEFGKGELKPYHGKRKLRSKKQDGSKKDLKQALAIAFSEAGLTEAVEESLTQGQQYAVDFLRPLGLTLVSSPIQLKHGNLVFEDTDETKWTITKTGYVRKLKPSSFTPWQQKGKWQLLYSYFSPQWQMGGKKFIEDDEYMELAHILSEKVRKSKVKKSYRKTYVDKVYKRLVKEIEGLKEIPYGEATDLEVIEAVKKLYNKYVS